jgi:hypothetical protein
MKLAGYCSAKFMIFAIPGVSSTAVLEVENLVARAGAEDIAWHPPRFGRSLGCARMQADARGTFIEQIHCAV